MTESNPDQVIRTYLLRRAQDALGDPETSARDVLFIDAALRLGAFSDVDPIWLRWSYMLKERGLEEDNNRKLDAIERRAYSTEDARTWLVMGEEPRDNWPRPYGAQGCEANT